MEDLFGKCGNNCGRCPSYKENLKTEADRQRCSDGWFKYLGFRLSPDKFLSCDGCQMPNEENPTRYYKTGCRIRRCAERNGVETCAHCSEFPCDDVRQMGTAYTRKAIASRLGIPEDAIPEEDYLAFIEPYESLRHLEKIRKSLSPEDIVKNKGVPPIKARAITFPEHLPFSKREIAAYKNLHDLLRNVLSAPAKTYARQELLNSRRPHMLSLLWILGYYGELQEGNGSYLLLDGAIHGPREQCKWLVRKRDNSLHGTVRQAVDLLTEYGVQVKFEPLKKGGYLLKMSFDEKAGGEAALKALKNYTVKLADKYGEPIYVGNARYKGEAFTLFSKADMRILGDVSRN